MCGMDELSLVGVKRIVEYTKVGIEFLVLGFDLFVGF